MKRNYAKRLMLAFIGTLIALVVTACGGGSGMDWTEPATSAQIIQAQTYLDAHKDTKVPSGWKQAVVLQIGIEDRTSPNEDNWWADVRVNGAEETLKTHAFPAKVNLIVPIDSLDEMAFVHPGDFIAFDPQSGGKHSPKTIKVLAAGAVTIG